jgi:hypothetical protein
MRRQKLVLRYYHEQLMYLQEAFAKPAKQELRGSCTPVKRVEQSVVQPPPNEVWCFAKPSTTLTKNLLHKLL